MMRKLIILLAFIVKFSFLVAQLPDPIKGSTTSFGTITSDYGPRHYAGSKFHNGVDYQCILGHKAYVVESGYINRFGGPWGTGTSLIEIISGDRKWRYMHVESQTYLQDDYIPLWEYCENCLGNQETNDNFIFLRTWDDVNQELHTSAILTTTNYTGNTTSMEDPSTSETVNITSSVSNTDWIFMPGDYTNYNPPYAIHFHIDNGRGFRINPLSTISHSDINSPFLQYSTFKRPVNNQAQDFAPYNILYGSTVISESKVITTEDLDLNVFSITLKKTNSTEEYYDEWRISKTGNKTSNIKTTDIILAQNMNDEAWIQDQINKGVYPYDPNNTINQNAQPGYDYFKLHWNSTSSIIPAQPKAYVNWRANYSDGKYEATFNATDINGNTLPVTKEVVLDNHIPYVLKVDIYSGNLIYSSHLQYNNPTNPSEANRGYFERIIDHSNSDCADKANELFIDVQMSEPMLTATLEIRHGDYNGEVVYSDNLQKLLNDPIYWSAIIPKSEVEGLYEYGETYVLSISGYDMAGNNLVYIGLSNDGDVCDLNQYPYRDEDGNWTTTSYIMGDRDHSFKFCEFDKLRALFDAIMNNNNPERDNSESLYGFSPLTINFNDNSTGSPQNWSWDFGDNSLPVNEQNSQHTFVNEYDEPIQYNVSLKVCNENGCDIALKSKLITVYPEGYSDIPIADFTYTQSTYYGPYYIQFNNYSAGNITTTLWDFGDGQTSSSSNPEPHEYNSPGTYLVTLTLNQNATEEVVFQKQIEVLEGSETSYGPIDFEWACIENIDNMYNAEGLNGELIDFKSTDSFYDSRYEWDMGDGNKYYNMSKPSHSYLNTGVYPVTLTIKNSNGELIGQKTKLITVVQSRQIIPPSENEISLYDNLKVCDLELQDDELFVTVDDNPNLFVYKYNESSKSWALSQDPIFISDDPPWYFNIEVSGDLLCIAYTGFSDLHGKMYFFKRVNNVWIKQSQVITDPEANNQNFGIYFAMDNNWMVVTSYRTFEPHTKVLFWKYNEYTNTWQTNSNNDFFINNHLHLAANGVDLNEGTASCGGNVFVLTENDNWIQKYSGLYFNSSMHYPTKNVKVHSDHYTAGVGSTVRSYQFDGVSYHLKLPVLKMRGEISWWFAPSISEFDNYMLAAFINKYDTPEESASVVLFRRNQDDVNYNYSQYRTLQPLNSFPNDWFGLGVRINEKHIVVASNGVDDGQYYKAPSIYYYNDYAYFGDRDLTIESVAKYKTINNVPLRFEARNIEIGGSSKASVVEGDDLELIGQKVVLSSGFSATSGAIFKASGTICNTFTGYSSANPFVNDTLKETVYLPEIGSDNITNNKFKIVPNPGTSQINIYANDMHSSIDRVELFELKGKQILSKEFENGNSYISMDISFIPKGVYVVAIYSKDDVETLKFVKL